MKVTAARFYNPYFCFCGNTRKSTSDNLSDYKDFTDKATKVYSDIPFYKVARRLTKNENLLVGEGAQKRVYAIPGIDDYLVAKLKKIEPADKDFVQRDELSRYNFGQPIATNGSDLIIMKKVEGQEYSTPNSILAIRNSLDGKGALKADAEEFLRQIQLIEDFPLSSYVHLANQIKYLTDNNLKIDNINPNNILVDFKNRQLNYIDIIDRQERFAHIYPKNGTMDMICLMTNCLLQRDFLRVLDETDKEALMKSTKKVIKKCRLAGKAAGLDYGIDIARKTFKSIPARNSKTPRPFARHYEEFLDIYKDVI